MRLSFQVSGSGEPLIILHGLFGSSGNWRSVARELSGHFRVFTPDMRNHGGSPFAPEHNYEVMAQDLLDFMDQQGLEKAHVLGHSMGGKAAMVFASRWPQRLASLMVEDIAPRAYAPLHDYIFRALRAVDFDAADSRQAVEEALSAHVPEAGVRQFLLTSLTRDEQGRLGWALNLDVLYRNYDALNAMPAIVHEYAGPVLFLCGGNSDYVRPEDEPLIREWFPKADIVRFPNAHHWPHIEAPVAFIETVKDFASGRPAADFA